MINFEYLYVGHGYTTNKSNSIKNVFLKTNIYIN